MLLTTLFVLYREDIRAHIVLVSWFVTRMFLKKMFDLPTLYRANADAFLCYYR